VLAGPHHAIHEFKVRMSPGGPVDATVRWFFATGRSEPVVALTFDSSPAGPNVVNADTRAPYGDFLFEGTSTPGPIGGIGWGDNYRFTTTGPGPVTAATPWQYTEANNVPYVRMWSSAVDAEMGAVQTETFDQHVGGGDYGNGLIAACQGKTSANRAAGCSANNETMPQSWLWPFQLNQYELPFTNTSHRLAWGANYGAIGQNTVSAFGKTFTGYPKVSYAVFLVVDGHTGNPTLAKASAVEKMVAAQAMNASWNPGYAIWDVPTSANRATASIDPKGATFSTPILRFTGFTATQLRQVQVNGVPLTANDGYFASFDPAGQAVWITLNGTVSGPISVHVE
jgi:hypothetical protein